MGSGVAQHEPVGTEDALSNVRTLPAKEYERIKAEAIRSLARERLRNPLPPLEAKDVRTMTKAEYEQFKRQTLKK